MTNDGNVPIGQESGVSRIDFDIYGRTAGDEAIDELLTTVEDQYIRGMLPGTSRTLSLLFSLPGELATGDYQILVQADPTDTVGDQDADLTDNNALTSAADPILVARDILAATGYDRDGASYDYDETNVGSFWSGPDEVDVAVTATGPDQYHVEEMFLGGEVDEWELHRDGDGTGIDRRLLNLGGDTLETVFDDLLLAPGALPAFRPHTDTSDVEVTLDHEEFGPLTVPGTVRVTTTLSGYRTAVAPLGTFTTAYITMRFVMNASGEVEVDGSPETLILSSTDSLTLQANPTVGIVRSIETFSGSFNIVGVGAGSGSSTARRQITESSLSLADTPEFAGGIDALAMSRPARSMVKPAESPSLRAGRWLKGLVSKAKGSADGDRLGALAAQQSGRLFGDAEEDVRLL